MVNALKQHNWVEPTPIQAQGWSIALSGRDLVGIADIESEKTLSVSIRRSVLFCLLEFCLSVAGLHRQREAQDM